MRRKIVDWMLDNSDHIIDTESVSYGPYQGQIPGDFLLLLARALLCANASMQLLGNAVVLPHCCWVPMWLFLIAGDPDSLHLVLGPMPRHCCWPIPRCLRDVVSLCS
jgi:hypothetical protein